MGNLFVGGFHTPPYLPALGPWEKKSLNLSVLHFLYLENEGVGLCDL